MDITGPRAPPPPSPAPLDLGDVTLQLGPGDNEGAAYDNFFSKEPPVIPAGVTEDTRASTAYSAATSGAITPGTAFPAYDTRFSLASTLSLINDCSIPTGVDGRRVVVVMGSGDFACALTARLSEANYNVIVASRDPQSRRQRVIAAGGTIMTYAEALQKSNLVVIAIPFQHVSSLPLDTLSNKILVDVSNRDPKKYDPADRSQAEHLQNLVPSARVVKAFNVLSAYTLARGTRGSKEVPVCSDDALARAVVCDVVRSLDLVPVDRGPLRNARLLEGIPLTFFPEWKFALIISLIIWIIAFAITFFKWQLCDNFRNAQETNGSFNWRSFDGIAKNDVSVSCAMTSVTLLALCYLPGVIAAYIQLVRGTKYSEFPLCLDRWLKGRKQLGLLMVFNAAIHVLAMLSDGELYSDSDGWRGPTFVACGIVTFVLAGVLGLASLPSVAGSMTWKEFSFLQSRVGWLTLLLAALHIIFSKWEDLVTPHFKCYLPSNEQFVVVLPVVTLVLKIPLLLPCVDTALTRIRQGYERHPLRPNTL